MEARTFGRSSGAVLGVAALALVGSGASGVQAMSLEVERIASGLSNPLFVGSPQGDDRLFIVEKGGAIKIRQTDGSIAPFLNLSSSVATQGERGLLGLTFDPNYATNGRFYVNYIDSTSFDTIVASYTVAGDPLTSTTVDLASRKGVIRIAQPSGSVNHKSGWMGFRPGDNDNLYIAVGDAEHGPNAQNDALLLGKMLRINPDETGADADSNYAIPAGNPFVGDDGKRDEIWASGLRNPFRNSFDRATGDFYIADVGASTREELNLELAGAGGGQNYGWDVREGRGQQGWPPGSGTVGSFTEPVYDYDRARGDQSITGGYVYRGSMVPELYGKYIFGDFLSGRLFVLDPDDLKAPGGVPINEAELVTPIAAPGLDVRWISSFGEGANGELYIVDYLGGEVFAIVPEPHVLGLAGIAAMFLRRRRAKT